MSSALARSCCTVSNSNLIHTFPYPTWSSKWALTLTLIVFNLQECYLEISVSLHELIWWKSEFYVATNSWKERSPRPTHSTAFLHERSPPAAVIPLTDRHLQTRAEWTVEGWLGLNQVLELFVTFGIILLYFILVLRQWYFHGKER